MTWILLVKLRRITVTEWFVGPWSHHTFDSLGSCLVPLRSVIKQLIVQNGSPIGQAAPFLADPLPRALGLGLAWLGSFRKARFLKGRQDPQWPENGLQQNTHHTSYR